MSMLENLPPSENFLKAVSFWYGENRNRLSTQGSVHFPTDIFLLKIEKTDMEKK